MRNKKEYLFFLLSIDIIIQKSHCAYLEVRLTVRDTALRHRLVVELANLNNLRDFGSRRQGADRRLSMRFCLHGMMLEPYSRALDERSERGRKLTIFELVL